MFKMCSWILPLTKIKDSGFLWVFVSKQQGTIGCNCCRSVTWAELWVGGLCFGLDDDTELYGASYSGESSHERLLMAAQCGWQRATVIRDPRSSSVYCLWTVGGGGSSSPHLCLRLERLPGPRGALLFHGDGGRAEDEPLLMHNTWPSNGIQPLARGILTEHSIFDRNPAVCRWAAWRMLFH